MSGEFINNREWCETILKDSRRNYKDMVSWGVEFPPEVEEKLDLIISKIESLERKIDNLNKD